MVAITVEDDSVESDVTIKGKDITVGTAEDLLDAIEMLELHAPVRDIEVRPYEDTYVRMDGDEDNFAYLYIHEEEVAWETVDTLKRIVEDAIEEAEEETHPVAGYLDGHGAVKDYKMPSDWAHTYGYISLSTDGSVPHSRIEHEMMNITRVEKRDEHASDDGDVYLRFTVEDW